MLKSYKKTVLLESIRQGYPVWDILRYQRIANIINQMGKKCVLDIGCGIGLQDSLFVGKEIVGIDLNLENVKKAKNITRSFSLRGASRYSFIIADLRFPPLKKQTFDIILCAEVLEHLQNDKRALKIILSLSKKNGLIVLTVPNSLRLSLTRTLRSGNKRRFMDRLHFREYNANSINTLLKSLSLPVKINSIKGIYFDFLPFIFVALLCSHFRRLRSNTVFHFFTYDFLYKLYEKLWLSLEKSLWQRTFFLLIILQHQ